MEVHLLSFLLSSCGYNDNNEIAVPTIFNPAPGLQNLDLELLKYSDILCPNENEASIFRFESCWKKCTVMHRV